MNCPRGHALKNIFSLVSRTLLKCSFLASNIFERHHILVNSIGTYPEENDAYFQIQIIVGFGFSSLALMTMVQLVSYYLYNCKYHPFNKIVQKDKTCKMSDF